MRKILSLQNNYDIYEGTLIFLQNKSYPQANPNGIYGTVNFNNNPNITYNRELLDYTYFLRASNALIFSGCTPPKSIYFSIVSYLFNRHYLTTDNHTYFNRNLFASLGAALNNFVWNTSNTTHTNSYDCNYNYNSLTTVIQTGDQQTYIDIFDLLTNNSVSNISTNEINLQSLPNKYINYLPYNYTSNNIHLYNKTFDTGTIVFRVTLPYNKTQYYEYINRNQTVFMLQPKKKNWQRYNHYNTYAVSNYNYNYNYNDDVPRIPYNLSIRNTYSKNNLNETCSIYNDSLNEYKIDLINYLTTNYSNNNNSNNNKLKYVNEYKFKFIEENQHCQNQSSCYGILCIENNSECLGDNRDTLYSGPSFTNEKGLTLSNNSFYILLGLIHTNGDIKQTIYSSITFYDHHNTPLHNYDNPHITDIEYNGSGLVLPIKTSVDKNNLKNIFVVQLAPYDNCILNFNLSTNLCINNIDINTISYGTFNYRNYLNPNTKTRPDYREMIPTVLLNFTYM